MNRTSDIRETADDLNDHPVAPLEVKIADEIDRAAQNTLHDVRGGAESAEFGAELKGKLLRSRDKAYVSRQSLSTMPLTLVAGLLAGLVFFLARVISYFSGRRTSGNRQRRR